MRIGTLKNAMLKIGVNNYTDLFNRIDFNYEELDRVQKGKRVRKFNKEEVAELVKKLITKNPNFQYITIGVPNNAGEGTESTFIYLELTDNNNIIVRYRRDEAIGVGSIKQYQAMKSTTIFL